MTRTYRMGFTPMPHDAAEGALDETYAFIAEHGDVIAHHFDEGIPWDDALHDRDFHPHVRASIDGRLARRRDGQAVFLAVSAVGGDRTTLAGEWGAHSHQARTGEWAARDYDSPEAIEAYTKFCLRMIDRFRPNWFAYGIEVNIVANAGREVLDRYLRMCAAVYPALKAAHPELPVMLTVQVEHTLGPNAEQLGVIGEMLEFSDMVAVSSYAFMGPGFSPTSTSDPAAWTSAALEAIAALDPDKPFAIAETGYISRDLVIESMRIETIGRPEWQASFLDALLDAAERLRAQFVVWFVPRDYHRLWEAIKSQSPDFFSLWMDTGLAAADGTPKPALEVWDRRRAQSLTR